MVSGEGVMAEEGSAKSVFFAHMLSEVQKYTARRMSQGLDGRECIMSIK